jgi:hypothetical protein
MTEISQNRTTYVIRKLDGVDANKTRTNIVRLLLRQIVVGLKVELDPAAWVNAGWAELESFVDAFCDGGTHPALLEWMTARANSGRPAPSTREAYARRLVVLMCESLRRAGLNRRATRELAAQELAATGVFDNTPSPQTIEHWQRSESVLAPADELLISTGFAASGGEPAKLAIYFIGLLHLALNPTAMAVRENAQEGGAYIARLEGR